MESNPLPDNLTDEAVREILKEQTRRQARRWVEEQGVGE